jgi:hypothetical protein
MQVVTSTTGSPPINRTSHAIKVSVAALAAKALIAKYGINRNLLLGSLAASALAFPAVGYTYDVIHLVKPDHSAAPYNKVLNRIWGYPGRASCRTRYPLVSGIQFALLLRGLQLLPASLPLRGAVAAVACFPQARGLWDVLSIPPSGAVGGGDDWLGPRRQAVAVV